MLAPIIPGLTDTEIPSILKAASEAGARHASFVPLRLPLAVRPLFEEWLETHYPDRKDKIVHRIQSVRGGKMNDPNFGSRMQGEGIFADQIGQIFNLWAKKYGFNEQKVALTTEGFQRPGEQLSFF
jgi:DNA repair photolyase